MRRIAIVDYGSGNLGSIQNILKKIGANSVVCSNPLEFEALKVNGIILPGVGAYDSAVAKLHESGWFLKLTEIASNKNIPVLGICLGMQLLLESSEEGELPGLGLIKGSVLKFTYDKRFKIPHMGWNFVHTTGENPLTSNFQGDEKYYFVHSYYAETLNDSNTFLTCRYGGREFSAGIVSGNIYGVQFHPEKSHQYGIKFFKSFVDLLT